MKRHPSRCFMNNNKITNKRDRARLSQKQAPSLKIPFRHLVSNESEKQQTLRIKSRIIVLNCPSFTYPSNSKSTVSDSILLVTHTQKKNNVVWVKRVDLRVIQNARRNLSISVNAH